jgi:acetyl esterase
MALHPECRAFLDTIAAAGGSPIEQLPLTEARSVPLALIELGGREQAVARVENRTVPGPGGAIAVRVYRPRAEERLPALMFFHGGGFVICNLDTHDRQCRALANASGCTVVSVDYRLAPEHRFPAAPEDAYAATQYVAEHADEFGIDPDRLAVGGDSAGGNLATVVALMSRERGGPSIKFQLLIYPVVDWEDRSPSIDTYGEGHFLTHELMDWFLRQYFTRPEDARHPYASPLRATDLRGLPPATVITAECDPVRDQGEAYARRLAEAGVPVQLKRYEGMIHPFLSLSGIVTDGANAIADAARDVRQAIGRRAEPGAAT